MQGISKRHTGPVAFTATLLLIFIFAVAAFTRYEKGNEPQAPLFPADQTSHQSAATDVSDADVASSNPKHDNPLTTTVKALVEEQQAMEAPADDETNPNTRAQRLVEQAEQLMTSGNDVSAPETTQTSPAPHKFESNADYQRRMAEIQRLRARLAELNTKP